MGLISLFFQNPVGFFILAGLLLYSIIAHEVAHGWVASLFGDDTAKRYGRLTLNPAPHIDPMGLLMLFFVGFGWARPVPVNYSVLQRSRFGVIAVSFAGCLTNILIAIVAVFLLQIPAIDANPLFSGVLYILVRINIILGAFNLIPIPPLDGSRILMVLLPERAKLRFARLEPYGLLIIAFLLFSGLLNPIISFMQSLVYAFISVLQGMGR
ncbi:MAG: site-2 protease family protein [Candidatus Omnitrophica bacterium]|nr:site-2 protease family protein [Candidatus Omnitrophota bacterium]MBU4478601.1 site-2 protease family protein [Candidatus Omnitrophota bacterium]